METLDVNDVDGATGFVSCTDLGHGTFRIEAIPFGLERLNYGDVIAGELNGDVLSVKSVVQRSGWRTDYYTVSREDREAEWVKRICSHVEKAAGFWGWYCGFLVVSLPPDSAYDPIMDAPKQG